MNKSFSTKIASLFFLIIFITNTSYSQKEKENVPENEKHFFKDTLVIFKGLKVEFIKSTASPKKLHLLLNVTNADKSYYVLDPLDVFVTIGNSEINIRDTKHKKVIIPPSSSQKIKLEFEGLDYRVQAVNVNFTKVSVSDEAITTYSFTDMPIDGANLCKSGPLTWFLTHKDYDVHTGVRLSGKLKYNGNNLLVMNLENATFKTSDGGVYNHVGEPQIFIVHNNKYFDFRNTFEKEVLYFPAKRANLKKEKKAVLNLTNAYTEYKLNIIDGFKIQLNKANN
jgi:hypothetical protein